MFAIKGKGGDGIPYVSPPTKVPIRDNKKITCWLYTIGVDAGKAAIMAGLKVQEPGPKYSHFNRHPDAGYDLNYFNGLLSEKLVLTSTRRGDRWAWEKLPGHNRNEALDCRDYANAGLKIINPDMDAVERRLRGIEGLPGRRRVELGQQLSLLHALPFVRVGAREGSGDGEAQGGRGLLLDRADVERGVDVRRRGDDDGAHPQRIGRMGLFR